MLTVCQFCQCKIFTNIEHQTTWIGIALLILLFIIFRIYSIFLIILLIPLTQSTIHTCPNCLNKIGVRTFYDALSLTDKVFTFQIFTFGIIITKKQLLGTFIGLFFLIIFYTCVNSIDLSRKFIEDTWTDYYNYCNKDFTLSREKLQKCKERYLYQDVSWTGYTIRINFDERFFSRYRAQILVKMNNNSNEEPDLFISFTDYYYEKYKTQIINTTRGDQIQFNATIISGGEIPILEVNGYRKLNDKIYINPHVHNTGRYHVPKDMIKKNSSLYSELPGLVSDEDKTESLPETQT